jgi:hypothetical protein
MVGRQVPDVRPIVEGEARVDRMKGHMVNWRAWHN